MLVLYESDVLGQVILFIIERFPLFGVSFNGSSTVYVQVMSYIVYVSHNAAGLPQKCVLTGLWPA